MRKVLSTLILVVLTTLISSQNAQAQLRYHPSGQLTLSANPIPNYQLSMYGSIHLGASNGRFLQINVLPANPRLAGTGNQVVFYNSSTSRFNSIQVANVYTYSDARAKNNIRTIDNSMDIISRLRPVSYSFIDRNMLTLRGGGEDSPEYGFLAQEVEEILPGSVITDEEGNKLVNYQALIPILVKAVQSLQAEVQSLKNAKN